MLLNICFFCLFMLMLLIKLFEFIMFSLCIKNLIVMLFNFLLSIC